MNTDFSNFKKVTDNQRIFDDFLQFFQKEITLPNFPLKVLDEGVCWITLTENNGWKLEQNMITHHARIIESSSKRRLAWGTVNGMKKAVDRYVAYNNL